MKKSMLLLSFLTIMGCSTVNESGILEDQLKISRKYIGNFMEYRQTGIKEANGPNILWIKTTMEDKYGKVSAYGKKCDFKPGDMLYLRRTLYSPGITNSYWEYYIENDSMVVYQATEFQHDKEVPIETWF